MRILVCGSRYWKKKDIIRRVLVQSGATSIINGDCRGADQIAHQIALNMGLEVITIPADWTRHGKKAGPIRNQEMLQYNPKLVIAFHDNIENSKGTKDMIKRAKYAEIPVVVIAGD